MSLHWIVGVGTGTLLFLGTRGLNVWPIILLSCLTYFLFTSGAGAGLGGLSRKKAGALIGKKPSVTFDDVGGQKAAKRELQEALEFLKDYDRAKKLGIRPLKGILLAGPPGTGKTLLAKAAANYTGSVFISASGSEFIEVYAGLGAQRVRDLFSRARKMAVEAKAGGAIIFIDGIEVLAGRRGAQAGHMEYDQTLNQLLVEMDGLGFDEASRILLIGATNRIDLLDSAIQRPGRFDRTVQVGLPDKEGRLEILNLHMKNKPLSGDVCMEKLARGTYGMSGAHLESLCNEAAIFALRKGAKTICQEDFEEALNKVLLGEKLDRRPTEKELQRVAVHEAGHAVAAEALRPGTVAQVTVSPRGFALGFVRHSPHDDTYIHSLETLKEEICILLAGAIAEDHLCGSRSTGAANDFEKALEIAKRIVMSGMSHLGPVDRDAASPDAIAGAIRGILGACENATSGLLERHKDALRNVAAELFENETIPGDRVRAMLGKPSGLAWKRRRLPERKGENMPGAESYTRRWEGAGRNTICGHGTPFGGDCRQ